MGQTRRHAISWFVAAVWIGLTVRSAQAYETGITGYSGKRAGITCNLCHAGGTAPSVHFEGPMQVATGSTAMFLFVVQSRAPSTQVFAGFDVAANAGQLNVVAGENEQRPGGTNELTHTSPQANDANGVAAWRLSWQAPSSAGTYTLFGAGNSVNDNFSNIGDKAATTTFAVVVDAATSTPTSTPTVTPTETASPTAAPSPPFTTTAGTISASTPTATVTPIPCVGDCDANGEITVDELVIGANIALGVASVAECPAFDCGHDGRVTVACLVQAVDHALTGCPP